VNGFALKTQEIMWEKPQVRVNNEGRSCAMSTIWLYPWRLWSGVKLASVGKLQWEQVKCVERSITGGGNCELTRWACIMRIQVMTYPIK